jgi:predicted nucleotidyltransferase
MTIDRPPAREVIATLVARWRGNAAVEAVLLFGSHAHGLATDRSDIDLSVLASQPALVPGHGLHRFQGHLVEVFVNTRGFYEGTFQRFHADNSRIAQSQFASAKILFDRCGEAAGIQRAAREWLDKPRIRQTPQEAEWPKRVIWLQFHRLDRVVRDGRPSAGFALHSFVHHVYAAYARFLGQPAMPADRLEGYLADDSKRESYLQEPFPDGAFGRTLLQALRERCEPELFELARGLKDQALRGMGGFEPAEMPG